MRDELHSLRPEQLTDKQQRVLVDWLTQLADDELVLGHRDSEWLGLCPTIEEDVAFSSIAQDEVGHAAFYYELIHELQEVNVDDLAFQLPIHKRKNSLLVERENGDWAYTIVRHYLYDIWDEIRLNAMIHSRYLPLAHGAKKMKREEHYHLVHFHHWFVRLAQSEGEAQERMKLAIDLVGQDLSDLLDVGPYEEELFRWGILTKSVTDLRNEFQCRYDRLFQEIAFSLRNKCHPVVLEKTISKGRIGEHSPSLASLLAVMTEVIRLDPKARW